MVLNEKDAQTYLRIVDLLHPFEISHFTVAAVIREWLVVQHQMPEGQIRDFID